MAPPTWRVSERMMPKAISAPKSKVPKTRAITQWMSRWMASSASVRARSSMLASMLE